MVFSQGLKHKSVVAVHVCRVMEVPSSKLVRQVFIVEILAVVGKTKVPKHTTKQLMDVLAMLTRAPALPSPKRRWQCRMEDFQKTCIKRSLAMASDPGLTCRKRSA